MYGRLLLEGQRHSYTHLLVCHADDVSALIPSRNVDMAQIRLDMVMGRNNGSIRDYGLTLALSKTEVVVLTKKRTQATIPIGLGEFLDQDQAYSILDINLQQHKLRPAGLTYCWQCCQRSRLFHQAYSQRRWHTFQQVSTCYVFCEVCPVLRSH